MEYLPRNIKIDWLRFQVSSNSPSILRQIQHTLGLPFERKQQQLQDARDTNVLALNKIWHEVYEFQGSLIGTRYPAGSHELYKYFVDLNGSALGGVTFDKVVSLLAFCQFEDEFVANRIDIALDFPVQTPRLSRRYWELFLSDNLLVGYRSIRRISNTGNNRPGTTVYLGSRESERFVRIYDKNIDGTDYDRLEIEFKRTRAEWIMQEMVACPVEELPKFLNGVVCGQIKFSRHREDIEFFKDYKYGPISVPAPTLHLDIERSIAFIEKHCATFAMVQEFMGPEKFDKFMRSQLAAGKLRMKPRHRTILENAKFLGVTALGVFLMLARTPGAIAGGNLTCPAPVPLSFQMSQKFPIDIVQPTPAEQAYFDNIGDGCFQINAGLEFERICLPGMIVNALKPFVIMGLGIKFIFSD
ncbi:MULTISPECIES: replication initiation factor domain-containing protein [unclassified Microcoleus]|uniref:replication initiation factor domain-containing protein n=1 Tax=unclassified Microcoleus TaxID=2642155 RepID=UPI002FD5D316